MFVFWKREETLLFYWIKVERSPGSSDWRTQTEVKITDQQSFNRRFNKQLCARTTFQSADWHHMIVFAEKDFIMSVRKLFHWQLRWTWRSYKEYFSKKGQFQSWLCECMMLSCLWSLDALLCAGSEFQRHKDLKCNDSTVHTELGFTWQQGTWPIFHLT